MSGRTVAEGDVPKVAPTSKFFAELRASLKNAQDVTVDLSAVVGRLRLENERLREALREVSNAYGCFAGCTGALPGAPEDGSGHTHVCRIARAAVEAPE